MKNQAVLLLLAILGATSVQAADTDRELARQLALQQKNLLPLLSNQQYQSPLPNLLQKASPRLKRQASDANQAAISRQGLDGEVKQLMQLRLANTDQAAALQQGVEPLVAYVPSGDEKSWSAIEAFDSAGNPVYLDVDKAPARPVSGSRSRSRQSQERRLEGDAQSTGRCGSAKRPASGCQHCATQDQYPEKDQTEG